MKILWKIIFFFLCVKKFCGGHVAPQGRVLGGTEVKEGFVLYIVSIQTFLGAHICGGVIIKPQWILTAAHCFHPSIQFMRVATGGVDLTKPNAVYSVAEQFLYCLFDEPRFTSDIALIKLDRPIAFNNYTKSIQMAEKNDLKDGDKLMIAGWGSEESDTNIYSNILRVTEVNYMKNKECIKLAGKPNPINTEHICTDARSGVGASPSDSGGPLIYDNELLVGINSWSIPDVVDMYASVPYYYDWINDIISGRTACYK